MRRRYGSRTTATHNIPNVFFFHSRSFLPLIDWYFFTAVFSTFTWVLPWKFRTQNFKAVHCSSLILTTVHRNHASCLFLMSSKKPCQKFAGMIIFHLVDLPSEFKMMDVTFQKHLHSEIFKFGLGWRWLCYYIYTLSLSTMSTPLTIITYSTDNIAISI